jgi:hypothetical protein
MVIRRKGGLVNKASLFISGVMLLGGSNCPILAGETAPPGFTLLTDAIVHQTSGCGGAIVRTPAPGTQFAGPTLHGPQGVVAFYEQAARRNAKWLATMHCTPNGLTHIRLPPPARDGSEQRVRDGVNNGVWTNWSGFSQGHTALYVQACWTVPTVAKPPAGAYGNPGPSKYYSSTWSGIGGSSAYEVPLIQSGTEQDITSGLGSVASYSFWYEVVGGPADTGTARTVDNLSISPGDSVGNVAVYDVNVTPPTTRLGVCNFSIPECLTFDIPDTDAPGDSVEWIVEAPSLGVQFLPLADFGSVGFSNACWVQNFIVGGNNTCSAIGSNPTSYAVHQDTYGTSQTLTSLSGITQDTVSSSFSDTYLPPEHGN